ncbi:SCO family protein [Azospirillum sp. 11R-A]|uniref:SCO family protein n=1 Tax=Azospirillum sp. 11R-A TaxID=3111634 RepID=UPI003C17C265
MTLLRRIRATLCVVAGVALIAVYVLAGRQPASVETRSEMAPGRSMAEGARWQLLDEQGRPFVPDDLQGRPTVIVFGFTHCPDSCPTSLSYLAGVLQSLGPRGDAIQPLFLTVDPERDSVAVMADYTDLFDSRIRGVTGAPDQMAAALKGLGVYVRKVTQDGGYSMDHSATILLLDSRSRLRSTLAIHEGEEVAARKIEQLLVAEAGSH